MALQRAYYFAELNLWAEVLREAFSIESPSAELSKVRSEVLELLGQMA